MLNLNMQWLTLVNKIEIVGNDYADRLANSAAGITKRTNHSKRIYLNVPFYEEKMKQNKMGARWESSKKKWYIMENNRHKKQMMGCWGTNINIKSQHAELNHRPVAWKPSPTTISA